MSPTGSMSFAASGTVEDACDEGIGSLSFAAVVVVAVRGWLLYRCGRAPPAPQQAVRHLGERRRPSMMRLGAH